MVATSLRIEMGRDTGIYYSSNEVIPGNHSNYAERFAGSALSYRAFGEFSTDGSMAYIQKDLNEEITFIALTHATRLNHNGQELVSFNGTRHTDLGIEWAGSTMLLSTGGVLFDQHNLPANTRIFSPNQINRVYLNGVSVYFTYANGYVTTSGVRRLLPPPQQGPGQDPGFGGGGPTGNQNNPLNRPDGPSGPGGPGGPVLPPLPPMPPTDLPEDIFSDIVGHWAYDEILEAYAVGLVSGDGNGRFRPNDVVTRAEFAAILVRGLGIYPNGEFAGIFEDVSANDWFAGVVEAATNAGLVRGYAGHFRPNDEISRQEMSIMLMTAFGYLGLEPNGSADLSAFSDYDDIALWAVPFVAEAVAAGLMSGVGGEEFSPLSSASRAQAAVVTIRLLKIAAEEYSAAIYQENGGE